jgi:hypothetical protein
MCLVWITSVKMCLRQTPTNHGQMVKRQIQAVLLGGLLSLLLLFASLFVASIIDANHAKAQMTPNARAQAPPPETELGCNDDVQISWPGQN